MDKKEFVRFLIESDVLKFGDFTTKSGRKTPYFINTGNYDDGKKLSKLGEFYAELVNKNFPSATLVFGPAYKGISLSVITAIKLYEKYGKVVNVAYNRKENKDHGEGGIIIGKVSKDDKVVIVEDVITSGLSVRESLEILRSVGNPKVLGVVVSVDRMEKGQTTKLASREIEEEFGIKVISIINVVEIIEYLRSKNENLELVKRMEDYLKENS